MDEHKMVVRMGAVLVLLLSLSSSLWAQVDTRRIDAVRDKQMLGDQDLTIIDRFLGEAVSELTRTEDFSKAATARATILSRSQAKHKQPQYAQKFSTSARRYVSEALKRAAGLPERRRIMVTLNLLVLIDNLGDPALTQLAFDYLGSEFTAVRYWAARIVMGTAQQVHDQPNDPLSQRALKSAQTLAKDPSADIQGLVVAFAARLGGAPGQGLLVTVADDRIQRYRKNQVQDSLLEIPVLTALSRRAGTDNPQRTEVLRRFVDLLDQVMQLHLKQQDRLDEIQKRNLISVLAEVDDTCLRVLLPESQGALRRAIEAGDPSRIQAEYERLLGTNGALRGL